MEIQDLIVKYFTNTSSKSENQRLLKLISEDSENEALFKDYVTYWNTPKDNQKVNDRFDSSHAYNNFINQIEETAQSTNKRIKSDKKVVSILRKKSISSTIWFKVAAGLIVLFGMFFMFSQLNKEEMTIYANDTKSVKEIILPDGTHVFLNRNAKLQAPVAFNGDTRNVIAEGEMFFNVQKNPDKPFIINCGDVDVKVLGTSFSVKTDIVKNVEVIVETGKVEVANKTTNLKYELVPGMKAVFSKSENTVVVGQNKDINYNSWQTGLIVFQNTSLPQVISDIERFYNVSISFDLNKLSSCNLTAKFDNESLDVVFHTLELTFGITVINKPSGEIIIQGEGC